MLNFSQIDFTRKIGIYIYIDQCSLFEKIKYYIGQSVDIVKRTKEEKACGSQTPQRLKEALEDHEEEITCDQEFHLITKNDIETTANRPLHGVLFYNVLKEMIDEFPEKTKVFKKVKLEIKFDNSDIDRQMFIMKSLWTYLKKNENDNKLLSDIIVELKIDGAIEKGILNDLLDYYEIFYIKQYDAYNHGHNLTEGGQKASWMTHVAFKRGHEKFLIVSAIWEKIADVTDHPRITDDNCEIFDKKWNELRAFLNNDRAFLDKEIDVLKTKTEFFGIDLKKVGVDVLKRFYWEISCDKVNQAHADLLCKKQYIKEHDPFKDKHLEELNKIKNVFINITQFTADGAIKAIGKFKQMSLHLFLGKKGGRSLIYDTYIDKFLRAKNIPKLENKTDGGFVNTNRYINMSNWVLNYRNGHTQTKVTSKQQIKLYNIGLQKSHDLQIFEDYTKKQLAYMKEKDPTGFNISKINESTKYTKKENYSPDLQAAIDNKDVPFSNIGSYFRDFRRKKWEKVDDEIRTCLENEYGYEHKPRVYKCSEIDQNVLAVTKHIMENFKEFNFNYIVGDDEEWYGGIEKTGKLKNGLGKYVNMLRCACNQEQKLLFENLIGQKITPKFDKKRRNLEKFEADYKDEKKLQIQKQFEHGLFFYECFYHKTSLGIWYNNSNNEKRRGYFKNECEHIKEEIKMMYTATLHIRKQLFEDKQYKKTYKPQIENKIKAGCKKKSDCFKKGTPLGDWYHESVLYRRFDDKEFKYIKTEIDSLFLQRKKRKSSCGSSTSSKKVKK